jgi:hypothetical protein
MANDSGIYLWKIIAGLQSMRVLLDRLKEELPAEMGIYMDIFGIYDIYGIYGIFGEFDSFSHFQIIRKVI